MNLSPLDAFIEGALVTWLLIAVLIVACVVALLMGWVP